MLSPSPHSKKKILYVSQLEPHFSSFAAKFLRRVVVFLDYLCHFIYFILQLQFTFNTKLYQFQMHSKVVRQSSTSQSGPPPQYFKHPPGAIRGYCDTVDHVPSEELALPVFRSSPAIFFKPT